MGVAKGDTAYGDERLRGEAADVFESCGAGGGIGMGLGGCAEDGAEGDVIDGLGLGGVHLGGVVDGEAEDSVGADELAGVLGSKVFLAEVEAGVEEGGVVCAIVEDELGFRFAAEASDLLGFGEGVAGPEGFMAVLEESGSGFEKGFGGDSGGEVAVSEGGGVEDGVDGR